MSDDIDTARPSGRPTGSALRHGADHVRIEVTIDGRSKVIELRSNGDSKVELELNFDVDTARRHDDLSWVTEPTGVVHVGLRATGWRASA